MTEQTNNTDMTDQSDRQDLEDRVEQLEGTIEKMLPSRRDALKLGGAAIVGGAAMSGTASAGSQSEGTIGTSGAPVDLEVEDINPSGSRPATLGANLNAGQKNVQDVGTLSTGRRVVDGAVFDRIEEFNQATTTSSTITKQFSLSSRQEFGVYVDIAIDSTADLEMFFNGEDSSGTYNYFDETGALQTNEDIIQLVDIASGSGQPVRGWIFIRQMKFSRPSFQASLNARWGKAVGFADRGNGDTTSYNSVTLRMPGGLRATSEIELWRIR